MTDPGYVLKAEQTVFADGLDMEGEGNRGIENDPKTFGLGRMQLTLHPGMRKRGWSRFGGKSDAQFCVCDFGGVF